LRIEDRRLKGVLVDVDRRIQHHGPPHVDEARSSSTLRTEPYDIHLTGRDPVVPASFAPAGSVEAIRQRSKGGTAVRETSIPLGPAGLASEPEGVTRITAPSRDRPARAYHQTTASGIVRRRVFE